MAREFAYLMRMEQLYLDQWRGAEFGARN